MGADKVDWRQCITDEFLDRRHRELDAAERFVGVGYPCYGADEIVAAVDCLLDLKLSQGAQTKKFETDYARVLGVECSVATNSGSSANLLALSALMEAGEVDVGDEVIVPASTFASVSAPIYQLGLIPVYVDVCTRSWCIDPQQIEIGISDRTRVVMPVHNLGFPADMKKIGEIAADAGLVIVEDCCEAHGATIDGRQVGSFGDMGTFSFYVAHNITTGEGGLVACRGTEYEPLLRSLREFGRMVSPPQRYLTTAGLKEYDTRYVFDRLGFNVRMTDLCAALGNVQLQRLPELNRRRLEIAGKIHSHLLRFSDYVEMANTMEGEVSAYYTFPIMVKPDAPFTRRQICEYLEKRNIETRSMMGGCLPDQPGFIGRNHRIVGSLENAREVRDQVFFVGCHPGLSESDVVYMLNCFDEFLRAH